MKVAIINDIHFGIKNDNPNFLNYQLSYFEKEFIPYLITNKIDTVFNLGDTSHNRKHFNIRTYNAIVNRFFKPLKDNNIKMYIIPGNHDEFFTHENGVSFLDTIREYANIKIITEPTIIKLQKDLIEYKCSIIPWLANKDDVLKFETFIKQNSHDYCFGHFEMSGFNVIDGYEMKHSLLERNVFDNFKFTFSGHYHNKQVQKNFVYLGAQYQQTWNDYGHEKGFHVFDFATDALDFVLNTNELYYKIYYKESEYDKLKSELLKYKGKYVKVFVVEKENDVLFQEYIMALEQIEPEEFIVIDDNVQKMNEEIKEQIDAKNIIDTIKDYLIESEQEDKTLEKILIRAYTESVNVSN